MNDYEKDHNNENTNFILVEEKKESKEDDNKTPKKKKKGFRGNILFYIALALVTSFLGGFAAIYAAPSLYGKVLPYPDNGTYQASETININTNDSISTVSAVAKKSMSSVVGITTVATRQTWPFFNPQDVGGVGSGVIVARNGYILTNSHVVADGGAKELKVLFENGDQVDGEVIWNDSSLDLAIVKVDKNNLPVADLGDSDKLEVGEIAIAIGNPLGLDFQRTVTSGIISGLNRSVAVDGMQIDNLIQTDASINPGNSGGPLLNGQGEVIGINTAKISSGEGLGFAIPINQVKAIVEEVLETGSYKMVYIGIKGISLNEYEARLGVDLSADNGVVVIEVFSDSPALKAGLQVGDIITRLGDKSISDMDQLRQHLYGYKQGDKEDIIIIRNGQEINFNIEFSVMQ